MIEFGMRARPRGKTKQLQDIAHEFMELHGEEGFDLGEVIGWAIRSGRYQVQPPTAEELGKQELARALRQEYYTDPQGREVRRMHPVRITDGPQQMVIWHDITKAPPAHMRISFQQRRQGILADCTHHRTDVHSYNENNTYGVQLAFDYDFTPDLEEGDLPSEYNDEP